MKTLIMYYTFGGSSKKEAEKLASENEKSVLCQVTEVKKKNIFTAFFSGCPNAMKRKASKINNLSQDPEKFDRIILVAPIWAGYPVPAFNAMVELLPEGKEVSVYLCSGGGEAPKSKEGTCKLITDRNCKLLAYHDVKTGK
ncbi:flavodoxin [Lachnospiraceae bacterium KM106-2]|nr:flavodoxin [Lachnospiraceae bacterium KM106-2]